MTTITEVLANEHRRIDGVLSDFAATGDMAKVVEGCSLLDRHIQLERQVLCRWLREEVSDAFADHLALHFHALEQRMGELRSCEEGDRYVQLVTLLRHDLRSHAEESEAKILPAVHRRLGVQTMEQLVDELQEARKHLAEATVLLDLRPGKEPVPGQRPTLTSSARSA